MKSNIIAFAGVCVLIGFVVLIGFLVVKPVLAQVDATSTDPIAASTTPVDTAAASSTHDTTAEAPSEPAPTSGAVLGIPSSEPTASEATSADAAPVSEPVVEEQQQVVAEALPFAPYRPLSIDAEPKEPMPEGLTEVHIIGMGYTDYFTDGTQTFSFPGNANIGSLLHEPDAPVPTHDGLTWLHTIGRYVYDTASGELEIGQYALQPSGTYVANPFPFVSSTSSPETIETDSATSS